MRLEGRRKKEAILLPAAPAALAVASPKGADSTALDVEVPSPAAAAGVIPTVVAAPAGSAPSTGSRGPARRQKQL